MKEEWRTVVIDGKEHPWYSVSNLGNVRSHLEIKKLSKYCGGFKTEYNPNSYKDLKPSKRTGRHRPCQIAIAAPKNFFEEYQYKSKNSSFTVARNIYVHQLVMEAFCPMDEFPPDKLKDCWDDIPEDAKTWIKETVTINHIDHDPSNNRVDNLEYVTPRENTRAAVKHYGGNVANKSKQDDDEFMVFTEPKFNVLFQEWEDGRIDFYGEEGEECYNMLIDISKERDISPGEAFWEVIKEGIERERTVS